MKLIDFGLCAKPKVSCFHRVERNEVPHAHEKCMFDFRVQCKDFPKDPKFKLHSCHPTTNYSVRLNYVREQLTACYDQTVRSYSSSFTIIEGRAHLVCIAPTVTYKGP